MKITLLILGTISAIWGLKGWLQSEYKAQNRLRTNLDRMDRDQRDTAIGIGFIAALLAVIFRLAFLTCAAIYMYKLGWWWLVIVVVFAIRMIPAFIRTMCMVTSGDAETRPFIVTFFWGTANLAFITFVLIEVIKSL